MVMRKLQSDIPTFADLRLPPVFSRNRHRGGSTLGWHSFDQSLLKAFEAGLITEESAMLYCSNKGKFRRELDAAMKRLGAGGIEAPSGLKLNIDVRDQTPVVETMQSRRRVIRPRELAQ